MRAKEQVYYFTNIAPHYRAPLWKLMIQDEEVEFIFNFGKPQNGGIQEIDFNDPIWSSYSSKINELTNIRVADVVVWQSGVLFKVLFSSIKMALFLGDMNIISTWLAAIILRIKGSKVFFWGHGFSGNELLFKKSLRILFNKLAHQHLVYGHRAKNLMINYGFSASDVHVVYNSLDYENHKRYRRVLSKGDKVRRLFNSPDLPVLIFIGRLTPVKKLELLIRAIYRLNKDGDSYNLLIIGDGPVREKLEKLAGRLLQKGAYHFYGSCYNEEEIGQLLTYADLCVSPGNVGLTAIHSLSFGTPVCTHGNFGNQMPECEAIEPDKTGILFEEDNIDDLVLKIKEWFNRREPRESIRKECYAVVDNKYNPQHQIRIFKKALLTNE